MASQAKMPGTGVSVSSNSGHSGPRGVDMKGQMHVSEIVSDRAAAPSPFGDDVTFPLPVDQLIYTPTFTQE